MQLVLFQEPQTTLGTDKERIGLFAEFPYRLSPFSRRNWGHPWHSLCSYQSKLKPAIAHYLVKIFTAEGDVVLDPFAGVGTIPFEACLQGRVGVGIDINPVAYHSTAVKVKPPDAESISQVLHSLARFLSSYDLSESDRACTLLKNINGRLEDYFEPRTFREILKARKFFLEKHELAAADSFVLACLLHILHGNRPYALSRRSHGLTPFSPTGEFVYKPLLRHVEAKVSRMLSPSLPTDFERGEAFLTSVFRYRPDQQADVILTSPPFINSTRFYLSNWIRLWFCGWQDQDFSAPVRNDFLEEMQAKDISVYRRIFGKFFEFLRPNGLCVLHLGVTRGRDMGLEIAPFAEEVGFKRLALLYEDVTRCESHGLTDQGRTIRHAFLFLRRNP